METFHLVRNLNTGIDISKYIDGFNLNLFGHELNIKDRDVRQAIDAISFKLPSLRLLPYLPATISPCNASYIDNYLEHPYQVFNEYKEMGAKKLIGELKHMGSRGTFLLFDNEDSAIRYTGQSSPNIILSRTGLRFFKPEDELILTKKIRKILDKVNYFKKYDTDFVLWDCEILPWNSKGSFLIGKEFIPVLDSSYSFNSMLQEDLKDIKGFTFLKENINKTLNNISKYKEQLENYCWDCADINNIKIAPFHLLAMKNRTFFDKTHKWHLNHFNELIEAQEEELFIKTPYIEIDLNSQESMDKGVEFWKDITQKGYEGVMFKTETFIEKDSEGEIILPMMKARGQNYLRIIYGINYDNPEYLNRLRKSRNTKKKRYLHYKQMALSIISLNSFCKGEPLEKWHDYIFASLCLTNVVTDKRL